MTPGFIVLSWQDLVGRERACGIERVFARDLTRLSSGDAWMVLARLGAPPAQMSDTTVIFGDVHEEVPACESGADAWFQTLVAGFWGAYTAFAFDRGGVRAMVDPSGAGRAHLVHDHALTLITDRLTPEAMRAGGFEIRVDESALAGCLLDPGTMVTAPLLHHVTAMVPGTRYTLGVRCDEAVMWSPTQYACNQEIDENTGAAGLRAAVSRVVAGMAGNGSSLIELSGGLDSSILAGTMSALGLAATGINVALIGGDVDETRYAQATAAHSGIALKMARTAAYPDYRTFMDCPQAAHPYLYGVDDAFAGIVGHAAAKADRIVTGQGGDAVFFQPATPLTTIDRVRALGPRSGWQALLDDARRTRSSIWHHLLPVALDSIRPAGPPQDALAGELLTRDARNARKAFLHPWCSGAAALPPGRRLQVLMLANSLLFHSARPIDLGRPLVHPLLAQPVLESALGIPTWQLASGPTDRGLARRAFSDRLHRAVAARHSKGEAAAFYSRTALANLPMLRERLLGGALARAGILDVAVMERVLSPEYLFYSLDYRALILHAACEAWLSGWMA